jgi:hypothetical protein
MRLVWLLLAVTSGIAHADTAWSEYNATVRLRQAEAITEAACEIDVTLHGAIAEVEQRVRLANSGSEALAATTELTIPGRAVMVGLEHKQGSRAATAALAIDGLIKTEAVTDPRVLDADPAILEQVWSKDYRLHYRLIVQPIEPDQEVTITTRWIRTADIRGGALHLVLPRREGRACRGSVHAKPGPGATVARVRAAGVESPARTFLLADKDLALDVDLAFKRTEPLVWTQSESLGDGMTAQAITIVAPPARAAGAKRVLFVVDGSRSMELIGRHRVKQIVTSIARMLARGTEVEAIIYDRTATRVLGDWKPIDATQLAAIETAIDTHTAGNGSNAQAALAAAQNVIGATRETQIVVITDGVMSDDGAPTGALATLQVELHAIVLSNDRMRSPDAQPLRSAINRIGGSYTELDVSELDTALSTFDDWLRPSWLDLELEISTQQRDVTETKLGVSDQLPRELRAGSGFVILAINDEPRRPVLTGHNVRRFKTAGASGPTAPVAELALSQDSSYELDDLTALRKRHPIVDYGYSFVVLSSRGKIAASRRKVTASGGPFTRMVAVPDPQLPREARAPQMAAGAGPSAIDRNALEVMFKTQLQPAAFACYQRALARLPKLAGTAQFELHIGRGETTHAKVAGLGDATFDACLLDAAYAVTPSLPNPSYNSDDRTIANYPLSFSLREQKPFIIAGDADSSSPLDIDAIQGGVPVKVKAGDTSTPLGNLRPSKLP